MLKCFCFAFILSNFDIILAHCLCLPYFLHVWTFFLWKKWKNYKFDGLEIDSIYFYDNLQGFVNTLYWLPFSVTHTLCFWFRWKTWSNGYDGEKKKNVKVIASGVYIWLVCISICCTTHFGTTHYWHIVSFFNDIGVFVGHCVTVISLPINKATAHCLTPPDILITSTASPQSVSAPSDSPITEHFGNQWWTLNRLSKSRLAEFTTRKRLASTAQPWKRITTPIVLVVSARQ